MDLQKDIKKFANYLERLKPLINSEFYNDFNRVNDIIQSLYNASPFKVGDIVELIEDIEINNTTRWGWRGRDHFLIKGSKAEVKGIDWDCDSNNYAYLLEFYDESYIHFHTKEKLPVSCKSLYYFRINEIDAFVE